MKVNSIYPVLMTEKVKESSDFYERYFNFTITFEAEWYISMINKESGNEIALLDRSHETIPKTYRAPVSGMLINIEVNDVDALYQKLILEDELPLHSELKDELFGQRHFITSDPNGILIDVIMNIPADDSFSQQYN